MAAYKLSVTASAENDIRDAFLWYEEQKRNLGSLFKKHVNKAVNSILTNLLKTQVSYGEIRVFFLRKFPFGIHFRVAGNNILIVAVFHTSINPESWKER